MNYTLIIPEYTLNIPVLYLKYTCFIPGNYEVHNEGPGVSKIAHRRKKCAILKI